MRTIVLAAPAKVNLHLGVYPGRDARGYHRADSVMVALGVADRVSVAMGEGSTSGVSLGMSEDVGVPMERNAAWVAATRLCEAMGRTSSLRIDIQKGIPAQSGLGGSSSDAASVILALCRLWGMDASVAAGDPRVGRVARSVGADVAFFLSPVPSLLVGAGDRLARTFPALDGVPVVLLRPPVGVSTAAAYRAFDAAPTAPLAADAMCEALGKGDPGAVARSLYNNLAPAARSLVPQCGDAVGWLLRQRGVLGAQVTGSGSCSFAICDTPSHAREVVGRARAWHPDWWSICTKTVGMGSQFC